MVRYSLAIRGTARDASANMVVDEQEVDIFGREQLKEVFLCDVNPRGQVSLSSARFDCFQLHKTSAVAKMEHNFLLTSLTS